MERLSTERSSCGTWRRRTRIARSKLLNACGHAYLPERGRARGIWEKHALDRLGHQQVDPKLIADDEAGS